MLGFWRRKDIARRVVERLVHDRRAGIDVDPQILLGIAYDPKTINHGIKVKTEAGTIQARIERGSHRCHAGQWINRVDPGRTTRITASADGVEQTIRRAKIDPDQIVVWDKPTYFIDGKGYVMGRRVSN